MKLASWLELKVDALNPSHFFCVKSVLSHLLLNVSLQGASLGSMCNGETVTVKAEPLRVLRSSNDFDLDGCNAGCMVFA